LRRACLWLVDVNRFAEAGARISRLEYHYCPEALAEVAADLAATPVLHGYHQPPEILSRMIATAVLPWESVRSVGGTIPT